MKNNMIKATYKALILGAAIFSLTLVFSPKEAIASQVDECVIQSNVIIAIARARDAGLPVRDVIEYLVELGIPFGTAYELVESIYKVKMLNPEILGNVFFETCMGEAS